MTKKTLGFIVVAAAVVVSLVGVIVLFQRALMLVFYLPFCMFIMVLGLFYKLLHGARYPTGIVIALLLGFHHVNMVRFNIDFLNISYSLFRWDVVGVILLAMFLVGSAIAFMFPTRMLARGTQLSSLFNPRQRPRVTKLTAHSLHPALINPLKSYAFTVIVGLFIVLSADYAIYTLSPLVELFFSL